MSTQQDIQQRINEFQNMLDELKSEIKTRHEQMMNVAKEMEQLQREAKFDGQTAFTVNVQIESPVQQMRVFATSEEEALQLAHRFMGHQFDTIEKPNENADDETWHAFEAEMEELYSHVLPEDEDDTVTSTAPSYTLSLTS